MTITLRDYQGYTYPNETIADVRAELAKLEAIATSKLELGEVKRRRRLRSVVANYEADVTNCK